MLKLFCDARTKIVWQDKIPIENIKTNKENNTCRVSTSKNYLDRNDRTKPNGKVYPGKIWGITMYI